MNRKLMDTRDLLAQVYRNVHPVSQIGHIAEGLVLMWGPHVVEVRTTDGCVYEGKCKQANVQTGFLVLVEQEGTPEERTVNINPLNITAYRFARQG